MSAFQLKLWSHHLLQPKTLIQTIFVTLAILTKTRDIILSIGVKNGVSFPHTVLNYFISQIETEFEKQEE